MGNVLAAPLKQTDFIGELPGVVLRDTLGASRVISSLDGACAKQILCTCMHTEKPLAHMPLAGGGRFLKTLLCVHDEGGQLVVKVGGQGIKYLVLGIDVQGRAEGCTDMQPMRKLVMDHCRATRSEQTRRPWSSSKPNCIAFGAAMPAFPFKPCSLHSTALQAVGAARCYNGVFVGC
jgi:hypothetical protein